MEEAAASVEEGASRARRRMSRKWRRGAAASVWRKRGGGVGDGVDGGRSSEVIDDDGGEIRQPEGVGDVVGVVINCSCKWRDRNDGLDGRGLYTQGVGPGLWHKPVLKEGIGTS